MLSWDLGFINPIERMQNQSSKNLPYSIRQFNSLFKFLVFLEPGFDWVPEWHVPTMASIRPGLGTRVACANNGQHQAWTGFQSGMCQQWPAGLKVFLKGLIDVHIGLKCLLKTNFSDGLKPRRTTFFGKRCVIMVYWQGDQSWFVMMS